MLKKYSSDLISNKHYITVDIEVKLYSLDIACSKFLIKANTEGRYHKH